MAGVRRWSRWSFLLAPKWLAWHVFIAAAVVGMALLCDWQLRRALDGNSLSWAYTFEWPFFAVLALLFWAKTVRDEIHPPAPGQPGDGETWLPPGTGGAAAAGAGAPAAGPRAPED